MRLPDPPLILSLTKELNPKMEEEVVCKNPASRFELPYFNWDI